jgi:hypothetical protein
MMKKLATATLLALLAYFAFVGVAVAQGAVAPEDGNVFDLAKPFYEAIMGGQYWLAAMFGLILATTAAKRYLPGKAGTFVNGQYGQPATVLVIAFAGSAAAALVAIGPGAVLTGALAWAALKMAVSAAGGYALLKQFVVPLLVKLEPKAPAWLKWAFPLMLWAFSKSPAKAVAEKAGDDAVAAKPPAGTPTNDITEV